MSLRRLSACACALLIAANSHAGEERKMRIEVAIDDDTSGEQSFVFDSQDAGFDLQSMVVGESRNITDRTGNTADLRRTEKGFELDFNGKTIEIPGMHEHDHESEHEIELQVDDSDAVVVSNVKKVKVLKSGSSDGITIISGSEIDAATRDRIAEALIASGLEGDITYIDGSDLHGGNHQAGGTREVRIIKNRVDVTN